ncbi:MAG: hypothetical protein HS115_19760 [Spirochaetales bacterium]|nr:hypothetical protein [Spirochaetales bacterium]
MAESIRVSVLCHACGYGMKGSARYGPGHYVPEGLDFAFTATGKIQQADGKKRVKGEVVIVCPKCSTRCKYAI